MNNKALTLSLVMAALAMLFVSSYVTSIEEEAKKKYGTAVLVVVAKSNIKEMDTILETALDFKEVPKRFLEPNAVSLEKKESEDNVKDSVKTTTLKALVGTVAIVPIKKGEQITYNKITEPSMRTGLASQITPGKRALAVPVSESSGVAKLVKPGDRVDLIAILDLGGGKENKISKTILQDVVVLSTGRYIANNVARVIEADPYSDKSRIKPLAEDFSFTTVTLELEPTQAQILALVMANGDNSLTLSLRNNDDKDIVNFPSTGLADVLGADAGRVKAPQQRR
jgi:pilus assembly protein CpaB